MRSRPIAAIVLLLLVSAAGVVVVLELTAPTPSEPIEPIQLDPGAQAGEAVEGDGSARGDRGGEDAGGRGFEPPSAGPDDIDGADAPETPPPQIEVQTSEATGESYDDGGGD